MTLKALAAARVTREERAKERAREKAKTRTTTDGVLGSGLEISVFLTFQDLTP
jgi:hypothetical protein